MRRRTERVSTGDDTFNAVTVENTRRVLRDGFRYMRFPPLYEELFEDETYRARSKRITGTMAVGLLIFNIYLIADYTLVQDVFGLAVFLRLGFFTPIAIALIIYSYLRPMRLPVVREGVNVVSVAVICIIIVWLMLVSESSLRGYQHYGITLVILYATLAQHMRFWYSIAAALTCLMIYIPAVLIEEAVPAGAAVAAIEVMLGACVLATAAAYGFERDERRSYLFSLMERLRNVELEELARQDPLTKLQNRRSLDDRLAEIWNDDASSGDRQVAVLLFDVDLFKLYNDHYGHRAGDECLITLSEVVQTCCPDNRHFLARYGGEEFLLLIEGGTWEEASAKAEEVRTAVQGTNLRHELSPYGMVTVSIGIAVAAKAEMTDPFGVIEAADSALYAAKRAGRNRVWPAAADTADAAEPIPVHART